MTLKEKFDNAPIIYNENLEVITNYQKIADEFAIGFAEWFAQQPKVKVIKKIGLFNCYMKITTKELLQIFKKEKGL